MSIAKTRLAGLLPAAGSLILSTAFGFGCSQGSGASVIQGQIPGGSSSGGATSSSGSGSGGNASSSGSGSGGNTSSGSSSGGNASSSGSSSGGESDGGDDGGGPPPDSWGTPVAGGPTGSGTTATVTVDPSTTVGTVSDDFVGFSYEKTHITNDSLDSTNTNLIALYKLLASSGSTPVMRLGANDSDRCNWGGMGAAPTSPSGSPFTFNVVSGMVDQLCSFLSATGSKVVYAINFESDQVSAAAAEAAYVYGKCGSSVIGIEIGNEINFFGTWSALKTQWETLATAILAAPGSTVIGPAASQGQATSFTTPFAADESSKFGNQFSLLTQHYYFGAANASTATVAHLQTVDPNLVSGVQTMNTAATSNNVPGGYRLGECNTFYGHGQMGVSDTLIAGLWSIDMMYVTAANGGGGVNFHGGETGMDGTNPFYYEPIMEQGGAVVQVQPIYYGMLFFALAGAGNMLSTTVTTSDKYFTAYTVAASGGWTSLILDNKDATNGISATVNLGAAAKSASAIYLQGTAGGGLTVPATGVTLAGASVAKDASWNRNPPYIQTVSGNNVSVYVPPASAALVRVVQ